MTAALSISEVSVKYGGHVVVNQVSIDVAEGQITGLIGPNGAGKTTLFNVVSGLLAPTSGTLSLGGRPVTRLGPHGRAQLGLGRTFQRLELFSSLTVVENIQVAGEIRNVWSDDYVNIDREVQRVLDVTGLGDVAHSAVAEISTGRARVVELGRALMARPKVLLLDEPASGQDESETEGFGILLRRLVDDGITIFIVEHDMDLVMGVCDYIHVLDFGLRIADGTPADIQANPVVLDAYLGPT